MMRSDALPRLKDHRRGKARRSLSERFPHKHDYTPALTPQTARAISTKTHTKQTAGNRLNSEVVEAAVTQHYPNSMYSALIRVCAGAPAGCGSLSCLRNESVCAADEMRSEHSTRQLCRYAPLLTPPLLLSYMKAGQLRL